MEGDVVAVCKKACDPAPCCKRARGETAPVSNCGFLWKHIGVIEPEDEWAWEHVFICFLRCFFEVEGRRCVCLCVCVCACALSLACLCVCVCVQKCQLSGYQPCVVGDDKSHPILSRWQLFVAANLDSGLLNQDMWLNGGCEIWGLRCLSKRMSEWAFW